MDRVLYFIGAGFSAPLGLPVMTNFLEKSKDQYFANPEPYAHFSAIFNSVRDMSYAKNFFETDLFNIEEILSVLETRAQLDHASLRDEFLRYVCEVVEYYTPAIAFCALAARPGNWWRYPLGPDRPALTRYAEFVGNLFRLDIEGRLLDNEIVISKREPQEARGFQKLYSVITMNYDLVLERVASCLYAPGMHLAFNGARENDDGWHHGPYLAKLHGSVKDRRIIPPTWCKLLDADVAGQWRLAYQLLSTANEIRVCGYSLPDSDSCIRYLFKSACADNPHLKKIDVCCLDEDGSVRRRYDSFIRFRNYRFRSLDVTTLLEGTADYTGGQGNVAGVRYNKLEALHQWAFRATA